MTGAASAARSVSRASQQRADVERGNQTLEALKGQLIALETLHRTGIFTILLIYGKPWPEHGEVWYPGTSVRQKWHGVDEVRDIVRRWYAWADGCAP